MNEQRGALVANRDIVDQVPFVQGQTTGALVPQNMGQALELAKIMAGGNVGVPKHLRGQPAVCMRVITDALQFALNPFHLADDSYVINDRLGYGAKSIHAMTLRSGVLNGRLEVTYEGQGANLVCTVSGRLRGATSVSVKSVRLSQITTMNSPLWKTDPQQQLGYYTERAWCRLHAPDAIMGLVAREDPMIDVTPEVVSINGDAPRGALAEVEAHLGVGDEPDEPEDETESASGETNGAQDGPGEEAAVEQDGHIETPAPAAKGADNGGQAKPASKRLGQLKHLLSQFSTQEEVEGWLIEDMVAKTIAKLAADEKGIWREALENHRDALDQMA